VESWPDVFAALGDHQQQEEQRATSGHTHSAHDLYLMANNSYRAAEYFALIEDHAISGSDYAAGMHSVRRCVSDWSFEPLEIVVEISGCLVTGWRRSNRVMAECCLP
jgi:hypothetical protein